MFISNILAVKAPDSPDSFQTPIYNKATKKHYGQGEKEEDLFGALSFCVFIVRLFLVIQKLNINIFLDSFEINDGPGVAGAVLQTALPFSY